MNATQVTVRDVAEVGPDTIAMTLATPDGFDADPGEFVLVRATVDGEELARHYTLSSPTVDDTFEITVGIDPDGDLTPWLAEREPGDTLSVEGPFGTVTYEGDGDVVVLAGGPGVGPAVGIGERARSADHDAAIVYLDGTPAHETRLSTLSNAGASVTVANDEDSFTAAVADVADVGQVYVFGFKEFCELSLDALEAAGVDPDDALVESFG
ncbi:flavodoxin reductase family protein [Salinarchaeum sp. Harcht-Bsk1]|uniref:FAD-dependent oxidoreductase n=1 Tax=Salinarchaeum sp. Harcht-Bsk1 TaxID=1333523 RepID=UPI0003423AF5|nr:FAD-dependent oxidoreductase [Salinarchaeum sp. Harcht-Bsk1]AGN00478.1 flavodoxin reductase family protein [Salinarchaeum sp. Harcht-Bsk1]